MDFLRSLNYSDESINLIKVNHSDGEIKDIINRQDSVISSILYLRELGVSEDRIMDLLIGEHHLLLPGREYLEKAIAKINNVSEYVRKLNEDITYADYLECIF